MNVRLTVQGGKEMSRKKDRGGISPKEIAEVLTLMESYGITHLSYSESDVSLKIELSPASLRYSTSPISTEAMKESPALGQKKKGASAEATAEAHQEHKVELLEIRSKLVGIFRSKPTNDFKKVKVGDVVKKGQSIGAIDTLSLLNFLKSPVNGRVKEIAVKDGDLVEYDQLLFIIEPF